MNFFHFEKLLQIFPLQLDLLKHWVISRTPTFRAPEICRKIKNNSVKTVKPQNNKHLRDHVKSVNYTNVSSGKQNGSVWYLLLPLLSQPEFTCSKLTIEALEQRCEMCSMLTIKTPKRRQWGRFGVFIVNFRQIPHLCSSVSIITFEHVIGGLH